MSPHPSERHSIPLMPVYHGSVGIGLRKSERSVKYWLTKSSAVNLNKRKSEVFSSAGCLERVSVGADGETEPRDLSDVDGGSHRGASYDAPRKRACGD